MPNTYLKAACLGVVAGMRSMAAPALVSHHLTQVSSETLAASSLRWLGAPKTATVFKVLALGEIVGDKLPFTPSRIAPGPLFGRILSGSLSGAALYAAAGKRLEQGAVIGGLAAVAGAYAFYHLRRSAGQHTPVPDPVLGAVEDMLAFGGGWAVLQYP